MADLRGFVETSPSPASSGSARRARVSNTGALFTADWQVDLVNQGLVYHAAFGAMGASDLTELTAGSNLDQPDFGISVPSGTTLIPLRITIAAKVPLDANDADAFFVVYGDPDAAYAGDGTVTDVTPVNAYTGGSTGNASVFEDASADITDPTVTKVFVCGVQQQSALTTSGVSDSMLNLDWSATVPLMLKGPAAIYGYGGGSDSVTWVGSAMWAEVPSSRFAYLDS